MHEKTGHGDHTGGSKMLPTISRSVPRLTLIEDDADLLYQGTYAVNLSHILVRIDREGKTRIELKSYHLNFNP